MDLGQTASFIAFAALITTGVRVCYEAYDRYKRASNSSRTRAGGDLESRRDDDPGGA